MFWDDEIDHEKEKLELDKKFPGSYKYLPNINAYYSCVICCNKNCPYESTYNLEKRFEQGPEGICCGEDHEDYKTVEDWLVALETYEKGCGQNNKKINNIHKGRVVTAGQIKHERFLIKKFLKSVSIGTKRRM